MLNRPTLSTSYPDSIDINRCSMAEERTRFPCVCPLRVYLRAWSSQYLAVSSENVAPNLFRNDLSLFHMRARSEASMMAAISAMCSSTASALLMPVALTIVSTAARKLSDADRYTSPRTAPS